MKLNLFKSPQQSRLLALLGILLLACGLILWHALDQYRTTEQEKRTLIKTALDGAAKELSMHLADMQRSLDILIDNQQSQIQQLASSPLDQAVYQKLFKRFQRVYPTLFGIMLADKNGDLLLDDRNHEIDAEIRADVQRFARIGTQAPLQLHSHVGGDYYYLLKRVDTPGGRSLILYLSFHPTNILRLLQGNRLQHYRIMLVSQRQDALYPIDPDTQSNNMAKQHLDPTAMAKIHYLVSIPGTRWEMVAMHQETSLLTPTWTSALWAFSLLLFLGSTALWLLRRSDNVLLQQSNVLQREQRRLNHLQQTTVSSELSFNEKIRSLLLMGLNEYDMEVAILSRVEGNRNIIVSAVSPDNGLQAGMGFNMGNTYCRHMLKRGKPVGIEHTDDTQGLDHPYFRTRPIKSFIGTTVFVHGKIYGTLHFSSYAPYPGKFTPEDFRFLQLMAQWIGLEIERRESEQQLQTKNQLLQSISRAQSYFISDYVQPDAMFEQILSDLLSLTSSDIGFIGEIAHDEDGRQTMQIRAISQRYNTNPKLTSFIDGMVHNADLLSSKNVFSEVLRTGAPLFSNNLEDDKGLQQLAHGSSPLSNFLGVPLYHGTRLVGLFALANNPGGFHESFLYTLAPLATASANLIWALRNEQTRIHTEHALRDSEEQLKLALEGSNDGLWDWDIRTNAVYYSPRWQTMLGYEPGEVKPHINAKEKLIHPDDFACVKQKLRDHLNGKTTIYQSEHRVKSRHGKWIWILDRGKVVEHDRHGKPLRAVGTHTDITERKQAEEAVRERETRIAAILDTAVDGIITINEEGNIETFNPAAEKIFGYQADGVLGRNVHILMSGEDRELHDTYIKRYLSTNKPKILGVRREVTGLRADGTSFPMQLAISEMRLGSRRHFTGIIRDITLTRQAEKLLQDTMAFKQGILDSAKLSIIATDARGIIQTFNAAAQQLLGYSQRELIGKATPEIFHDRDEISQRSIMLSEEMGQYVHPGFETFVAKARIGIADEQQWTYISKNGERFPVQLTMTALHDQHDNIIGFVAIARDISRQQQAEEEISRFKTTLDMTLDCVFMFSPETLRFFYVNQGAMEQVGYSYNELLRMTPVGLMTEHDEDSFRQLLRPMIDGTRNTVTFESYHRHHNGSLIPVEIFLQYIYPVDQEPRFVAIVRDITERRRTAENLAHAEERARLLLESAGEGIYGLDLQGNITFVNPAAARMLGYDAIDLIGKRMHDFASYSYQDRTEYPYRFSPTYKAITEGDIQRVSSEVMWRKDGNFFPVEYTVTPIRKNDNIAGAVVIFNDITERKKVEHIKNEFISTVSHELRTPLTSVRGSLGLLVGGAGGILPDQAQTLVDIANKNTERLLLLINDILDIEKIESGKMVYHYKLLNLHEFLEAAIQANHAYGQQFDIRFRIDQCPQDITIYADEDRLMQVMNNLLSNAAKFSTPGAQVELSAVQRMQKVRISVTDNGKGIPQNFQKHIFEKFAQADASDTRTLGGTGLGLSISKAIVEQHGGRIDFISRVNLGTTFYFDLPIWTRNLDKSPPRLSGAAKYRILICEDDADIGYMLRIILSQSGFDTDIARTVEQAKQYIKDNHYLAVTLDLALPDAQGRPYDPEGIRLIRELRRQDRTRELPVIVVSAIADQARRRLNGSGFGIVDWLEKPLDESRLLSAVQTIASHKQGLPRILHVEDDPLIYEMVRVLLRGHVDLVLAPSLFDAHQKLREEVFDLILLDVELTDGSGLDLIRDLDNVEYMPQVVIFSSHEVGQDVAQKVKAALVKSKDNRKELINVIMSVIRERDSGDGQQQQYLN